jgi:dihydrofolate synthase/folylpolyglutamate synthase
VVTRTLQSALEQLYGLERRRDKLGLDGTRDLLAALGHPERSFRAVHVAGTNGKGSTCALIERVLRESGLRTGLFTSPHLVDFRERIRVSGRWAEEDALFRILERVESLPEGRDRTFFEVATALGFQYFAESRIEWGVIEVGLGGRLDTTNVLEPAVCAITSIGLDHTEILGDTLEKIAAEKAGIVKPGVPVVLAPGLATPARETIVRIAAERGAPVIEAGVPFADDASMSMPFSILGAFEPANAATALAVLRQLRRAGVAIPPAALEAGFREARWPGRFERCASEPRLWWDGAHNPEGMAALERAWSRSRPAPPSALVLALSRDKDVDGVLAPLRRLAPRATLFATRSRSERALEPSRIAAAARAAGLEARVAPDVRAACEAAFRLDPAPDEHAPVLLTGSLFAVGEAMEAFGGAPGEMQ